MNAPTPDTPLTAGRLTDSQLDAALAHDDILPSSGFGDSVMAAIAGAGPAPIPFPWKRIWPLFLAAPVALAWIVFALVTFVRAALNPAAWHVAATAQAAPLFGTRLDLAALAHSPVASILFWILVSLAIPLLCLALTRRLLFSR